MLAEEFVKDWLELLLLCESLDLEAFDCVSDDSGEIEEELFTEEEDSLMISSRLSELSELISSSGTVVLVLELSLPQEVPNKVMAANNPPKIK